ncbi:MAG: pyridoxal 5'-phosphate synthase glutaminase subunit PdxT [Chloroflexi bacterium]|nr:pyridoxal 5'-phosphate synthase glutaminase subunit PdxT [Chloroflexota bacterium]
MLIGVLALQGDFREHVIVLRNLGVDVREVRLPEHLVGLDGLIIPGGESTTIGKLATTFGLMEPLRDFVASGHATWGTCAGAIFLAKDAGHPQPLIGMMDIAVARNAFGRQVESFETDLNMPELAKIGEDEAPFKAVFIRAPLITSVGPGVTILAQLDSGRIVAARQGNMLVTSFHPELTPDYRFHRYFLQMVKACMEPAVSSV